MQALGFGDRHRGVAIWLFLTAFLVFAMVVVGGATRLTGSGLSITEWKPIMGAVPPMNEADWREAFAKYQQIPQYALVNAGMSLEAFKGIFWWEWIHRQLGRLIGLVFAVPFFVFLFRKRLPRRLVWRCGLLLALGGLQGLIGWWMVSSGLSDRVDVAPERLTVHLGLALAIFMGLIWTGLEAWNGEGGVRPPSGWSRAAAFLLAALAIQSLLGALVAGSKAGMIYTDWPLMNGAVLPDVDWSAGGATFLHDQALVQFNHRMWGYGALIGGTLYAVLAARGRIDPGLVLSAVVLCALLWGQAILGVLTLIHAVPVTLGVLHQAGAAVVLAAGTVNLWCVRRSRARIFT
jgi:cytochrome c oxidase assembly protein subunit 15